MSRSWRRYLLLIVMLSFVKILVRVVFSTGELYERRLTAAWNDVLLGIFMLTTAALVVVAFKIAYRIYPREDEEGNVIQSLFDNKNSK